MPATLTPLQAVSAAQLLHARQLCPIHYGLHVPGSYEEYPAALAETQRLAAELNIPPSILANGQQLSWRSAVGSLLCFQLYALTATWTSVANIVFDFLTSSCWRKPRFTGT